MRLEPGEILIMTDAEGGTVKLTTRGPSRSGAPVLRVDSRAISGDFGPSDLIDASSVGGGTFPAAVVVLAWAKEAGRTPEEMEMARWFLDQWPEGPQI